MEGNSGKDGEKTDIKTSLAAEVGVGIASAKAKVEFFLLIMIWLTK